MRIGVDATSWFNGRGYGRFVKELLPALVRAGPAHTWLFLVEHMNAPKMPALEGVEIVPVQCRRAPTEAASADGYRSPRDLWRFRAAAKSLAPDLLFFPTVYSFFPVPRGVRAAVCIHDAIAERFPKLTFASRRARFFWNVKVKWALRQCPVVLTVSDFAADDLVRHLSVPRTRLHVISEAPSAVYQPCSNKEQIRRAADDVGLPKDARWFTYVGGFNPHKRVDVLLRAHARLVRTHREPIYLLLVGTLESDVFFGCRERLERLVTDLGTQDRVRWTGYVDDERLRLLHAGAVAGVLPSECEGFGLPAVETAACGTPVVATLESPLPALLEGGGLFIPPGDEEALAAAMEMLMNDGDRQRALGAEARRRTEALSWDRAARETLGALEGASL